jgi:hypothetical protein
MGPIHGRSEVTRTLYAAFDIQALYRQHIKQATI